MNLKLVRDYLDAQCSQGRLIFPGYGAETIERPWAPADNAPCGKKGVSCVPTGIYRLVKHNSESHPRTWALVNPSLWVYHWDEDVPALQRGIARTLVLIHSANFASELRGCIAPGRARAIDPSGRRMVTKSRPAMTELQALLPWDGEHQIEIT